MTMFPAHLSSSNYGGGGRYDCCISLGGGFSDLMAEDESRTQTNEETTGSSSKDIHDEMNTDDDPDQWLQLSLGGGHMHSTTSHRQQLTMPPPPPPQQLIFQVPEFRGHLPISTAFFLQPHEDVTAIDSVPATTLQQQESYYNYLSLIRPYSALNLPVSSSSSFSSSSDQHARPPHAHRRVTSRMELRVVNPPRRPHSGVWFMLQASQNQAKEPFLPQVPKSYLRIKDGRMTVGLLIKYLVNKLQLGSESKIEITCKGHRLMSLTTLQHVRDTVWNSPRNDVGLTLVPRSSATIDHLMVLNYGRIA